MTRANVEPRNELCHATDVPTDAKIRLIGRECRRFISFPGVLSVRVKFFSCLSFRRERERKRESFNKKFESFAVTMYLIFLAKFTTCRKFNRWNLWCRILSRMKNCEHF